MDLEVCKVGVSCCDKTDFTFAEESTCHGVSRFCNSWHIGRRLCWFLLVMASMGLLAQQLHERVNNFLNFELKTDVSLETYPQLALPSITICNMNMFTKSLLTPMDLELLQLSSSLTDWIKKTYKSYDTWPGNGTYWAIVDEYEKQEHDILARYNETSFTVRRWIRRTGWQLNSSDPRTVIQCTIGRQRCTVNDFRGVLTPQGLCYTLNWNASDRFFQKLPGIEAGFSILLDIDQEDYTAWKLDSEMQYECGAKVLLHEPYDEVYSGTTLSRFVGVDPGRMGFVAARKFHEIKQDNWPWSNCEADNTVSKRNCLSRCTADDTLRTCKCRLWFERANGENCGVARTTACLIYKETVNNYTVDQMCHSRCQHACNETHYSVSSSYTLLTSYNTMKDFLQQLNSYINDTDRRYTVAYVKRNILSFQVAYPDLSVDVAYSTPAFPTSAFISDLGGQLGLFAGISLVTIAELFEYPFVKLYSVFMGNENKSKKPKQSVQTEEQKKATKSQINVVSSSHYSSPIKGTKSFFSSANKKEKQQEMNRLGRTMSFSAFYISESTKAASMNHVGPVTPSRNKCSLF